MTNECCFKPWHIHTFICDPVNRSLVQRTRPSHTLSYWESVASSKLYSLALEGVRALSASCCKTSTASLERSHVSAHAHAYTHAHVHKTHAAAYVSSLRGGSVLPRSLTAAWLNADPNDKLAILQRNSSRAKQICEGCTGRGMPYATVSCPARSCASGTIPAPTSSGDEAGRAIQIHGELHLKPFARRERFQPAM